MEAIVGQLQYAMVSFLWGSFLVFIYDFILVLRRRKKHGILLLLTEDWLFWAIAALFVFQMIFALNNGVLRSFFVVAFLLGMITYRKLVKDRFQKLILTFFGIVFRPYVWILKKIRKIGKKALK